MAISLHISAIEFVDKKNEIKVCTFRIVISSMPAAVDLDRADSPECTFLPQKDI